MFLNSLELHNIRVYDHAKIDLDKNLNLIVGPNASGKTTILEAIHLLATGRSYRTGKIEQIRRRDSSIMRVQGQIGPDIGTESVHSSLLSITSSADGRNISLNGLRQQRISALAQLLPLQVISPDTHYEFKGSPRHRRAVLDWGLFHVEQEFPDLWLRYQRTLSQRNAALKKPQFGKVRASLDEGLGTLGETIHQHRKKLLIILRKNFQDSCYELLGNQQADLILESGWNAERTLAESLACDLAQDSNRGFTHSGPHRADLKIVLHNQSQQLVDASHGQYKLLVLALRLSLVRFFTTTKAQSCCLLIDDLAAELDREHRQRLLKLLAQLPIQVFITATETGLIEPQIWPSYKEFHVEQGTIK